MAPRDDAKRTSLSSIASLELDLTSLPEAQLLLPEQAHTVQFEEWIAPRSPNQMGFLAPLLPTNHHRNLVHIARFRVQQNSFEENFQWGTQAPDDASDHPIRLRLTLSAASGHGLVCASSGSSNTFPYPRRCSVWTPFQQQTAQLLLPAEPVCHITICSRSLRRAQVLVHVSPALDTASMLVAQGTRHFSPATQRIRQRVQELRIDPQQQRQLHARVAVVLRERRQHQHRRKRLRTSRRTKVHLPVTAAAREPKIKWVAMQVGKFQRRRKDADELDHRLDEVLTRRRARVKHLVSQQPVHVHREAKSVLSSSHVPRLILPQINSARAAEPTLTTSSRARGRRSHTQRVETKEPKRDEEEDKTRELLENLWREARDLQICDEMREKDKGRALKERARVRMWARQRRRGEFHKFRMEEQEKREARMVLIAQRRAAEIPLGIQTEGSRRAFQQALQLLRGQEDDPRLIAPLPYDLSMEI